MEKTNTVSRYAKDARDEEKFGGWCEQREERMQHRVELWSLVGHTMQKFVSDRSNYSPSSFSPPPLSLSLSLSLGSDARFTPPEPRVFVLLVFYGVARLTQDKIGLWYDHETHLFLYIVCTLFWLLLSFPSVCRGHAHHLRSRLDPSTCWTMFQASIGAYRSFGEYCDYAFAETVIDSGGTLFFYVVQSITINPHRGL